MAESDASAADVLGAVLDDLGLAAHEPGEVGELAVLRTGRGEAHRGAFE